MMKYLLKVSHVSDPRIESCLEDGIKPYLVRDIRGKDPGKWGVNEFFGTAICNDAMVDIHEGDLIATEMSFHVYGPKNHPVQRTSFSNIIQVSQVKK